MGPRRGQQRRLGPLSPHRAYPLGGKGTGPGQGGPATWQDNLVWLALGAGLLASGLLACTGRTQAAEGRIHPLQKAAFLLAAVYFALVGAMGLRWLWGFWWR